MNAKSRSCSSETCNFTSAYNYLKKHARLDHLSVRPSEADPDRERSWRRLKHRKGLLKTQNHAFMKNSSFGLYSSQSLFYNLAQSNQYHKRQEQMLKLQRETVLGRHVTAFNTTKVAAQAFMKMGSKVGSML